MASDLSVYYKTYITSREWKLFKARYIKHVFGTARPRCEKCKWLPRLHHRGPGLQLHHRTYERLGHERFEDVQLLCQACHVVEDEARRQAKEQEMWNARVIGYGNKAYGPDWILVWSFAEMSELLRAYLKRSGA